MKTVHGQLRGLGEHNYEKHGKTYSVIEIGDEHLTKVFVPESLDLYLTTSQRRECTLYLNQGRFLYGITNNDRTYAIKDDTASIFVALLLSGLFGFFFLFWFFVNFWDAMRSQREGGLLFMSAMFFGALAFFTVRAFFRNLSVLKDLGKVRALPGAILL